MSRRYWLHRIALGGLAAFLLLSGQALGQIANPDTKSANARQDNAPPPAPIKPSDKGGTQQQTSEQPRNQSDPIQDRGIKLSEEANRLQEKSNLFNLWVMVFTGFAAGAAGYASWAAFRALEHSNEANDIARDSARPLMFVNALKLIADTRKRGKFFKVIWRLQNVGSVGGWVESVCVSIATSPPKEDAEFFAPLPISTFLPATHHIYPPETSAPSVGIPAREFRRTVKAGKIYIYGYAVYRDAGGRRWKTGYFLIAKVDANLNVIDITYAGGQKFWVDERIFPQKTRWFAKWRKPKT